MAVDILYFLRTRLKFIVRFYDTASEPFRKTKEKIEKGEPPYVQTHIDSGEPEYQAEWNESEECLGVLGQACLSMVKVSLEAYLKAFVRRMQGWYPTVFPEMQSKLEERNPKGWLGRYERVFREEFSIDWAKSPVPPTILEEIVLARNDFEHNVDIGVLSVRQGKEHFQKFPESIFADDMEVAALHEPLDLQEGGPIFPWRLKVDRTKLLLATDAVSGFCEWLEEQGQHWPPKAGES